MMVNDLYEKHISQLALNARDLPCHLAFDLALETGSRVGNATWLALLRHCLAFTRIRRAGQRTYADAAAINSPLKSRLSEQRKGDWARPKHALRDHGKDKIGAQVMTEVSASLVLRFAVKSPRQSCISKGFISYWLLIDNKILIRQAGE